HGRGMRRRGSSGDKEGEIAGIAITLKDVQPSRGGHIIVHDVMNAPGRRGDTDAQGLGHAAAYRVLGGGAIQRESAAKKVGGIEIAQDQVRIADRWLAASSPIAGWTRFRGRALRPNLEQAKRIDPGDASTPSADLHQIDGRYGHGQAATGLEAMHPIYFKELRED